MLPRASCGRRPDEGTRESVMCHPWWRYLGQALGDRSSATRGGVASVKPSETNLLPPVVALSRSSRRGIGLSPPVVDLGAPRAAPDLCGTLSELVGPAGRRMRCRAGLLAPPPVASAGDAKRSSPRGAPTGRRSHPCTSRPRSSKRSNRGAWVLIRRRAVLASHTTRNGRTSDGRHPNPAASSRPSRAFASVRLRSPCTSTISVLISTTSRTRSPA